MQKTKLYHYIKHVRKISITQAADEIGITRPHLSCLAHGLMGGRAAATKIEKWSNGYVKAEDVFFAREAPCS